MLNFNNWTWTQLCQVGGVGDRFGSLVIIDSSKYKCSRENPKIVTKIKCHQVSPKSSVENKSVTNIYPKVKSKVDNLGSKWRSKRLEVENTRNSNGSLLWSKTVDLKDRPLLPSTVRSGIHGPPRFFTSLVRGPPRSAYSKNLLVRVRSVDPCVRFLTF